MRYAVSRNCSALVHSAYCLVFTVITRQLSDYILTAFHFFKVFDVCIDHDSYKFFEPNFWFPAKLLFSF